MTAYYCVSKVDIVHVCACVCTHAWFTVVTVAHSLRAQCLIPGCKMDYLVAGE